MDSEEAIMENENNSNLESESGIRDRDQILTVESLCDVPPAVNDMPNDISPSATFIGLGSSDSTTEGKSTLNEAPDSTSVTRKKFTDKSINEWEETHELEKPVEAELLEDTAESALVSNKREGIQDYEDFIGTSDKVKKTQNYAASLNSESQEGDDDVILSHNENRLADQNVQQMDVDETWETAAQSSDVNKGEVKVNSKTMVKSTNSESSSDINEVNKTESLKTTVASKYWDDDIDLLEDSQDSSNQRDNIEGLSVLTDNKGRPTLSGQDMTYKPDKLGVSSNRIETVTGNDDKLTVTSMEFDEQTEAETRSTLPEAGSFDAADSGDVDKMLGAEGNGAEEVSGNLLARTQYPSQDYEKDVEDVEEVLFEKSVSHMEKQNATVTSPCKILSETDASPRLSVPDDLCNESISDTNQSEDTSVENGAHILNETLGSKISSASKEQSSLETNVVLEDVVTEVLESAWKDSSFESPVSRYTSSSQLCKQADALVDTVNKSGIQREEIMETTAEITGTKPPRLALEDTALAVGLASTDFSQSSVNNVGSLEDTPSSDAVFESVEAANGNNTTSGEIDSRKLAEGPGQPESNLSTENEAADKSKHSQSAEKSSERTTECNLETTETAFTEKGSGRQKGSVNGTDSVSNDTSMTQDVDMHENSQDLMNISEIKKECGTSDVNESADDSLGMSKNESATVRIKQEPNTEKADDSEEDVIVIDDEGEFIPLKKEIVESRTAENRQDIHISTVSGQQHHLHASAEHISGVSSEAGNNKTDSPRSKQVKSKLQTCIVCQKICRCKYNIIRNGDTKHLCDDACFKHFRKSPGVFLKKDDPKTSKDDPKTSNALLKDTLSTLPFNDALAVSQLELGSRQDSPYKTCSVCQLIDVTSQQPFCNWKGLDFCGESCLGKFQANLNASCSFCHAYIPLDMRTTFCLKIGNDMRPFCKQRCYNEFKKKLRLCSFCQRDVAAIPGAFTAIVGTDGKFKEFCSQACMKKLESQVNDVEVLSVEKGNAKLETITCSVCKKQGPMKYTVRLQDEVNKLCSDLCLSAFQYTNKINMGRCDSCGASCTAEEAQAHFVQYEGKVKRFCSDICVGLFRKTNSKVMPCGWCGTKKLNFDMIERLDAENKLQMFCSLNCLSLYRVNLQAKSNQAVACDHCHKVVPAQYHLTMSDASVRNFCSYACVMNFQVQFAVGRVSSGVGASPPPLATSPAQFPTQPQVTPVQQNQQQNTPGSRGGRGGHMTTRQATARQQSPTFPVISHVVSLAPQGGDPQILSLPAPPSALPVLVPSPDVTAAVTDNMVPSGDGKHQILIQAAPPKYGKNKSLQCRPITQTKATSCRPHSQSKEVQTDEVPATSVMIPVPVPIYIPMPTVMFSAPAPKLVPVPIPIPVPIFIPTTRKSVNGICRTIKEIVERIPADPLEAEILMMADAVAADEKSEDSGSDTEIEAGIEDFGIYGESEAVKSAVQEDESSLKKKEGQGEVEMLQAALRIAEEMSGPIEDLETSVQPVAVNSEPPGKQPKVVETYHRQDDVDDDDDDDYIPPQPLRGRGAKRSTRGRPPSSRPKRQRLERSYTEDESLLAEPSGRSHSIEPAPDIKYRLKFSYGVNAWRHWVINKNMQIEKSKSEGNVRARVFPTDILQCTMEELNVSMWMFVSEVRKPSGAEYSPDSIYYLCLGLQQYLYENGRIDSIFTDIYFEKFTESLHEILKTLQPKVNKQGQMLCRIEEEHLWESKQLGAHSPFVLLNTLIYFHTKFFILKTIQDHMSLSFAQILKHWKKGVPVKGQAASSAKNVSLRFYCLTNGKKDGFAAKKSKEGVPVYEVTENIDNPLRCPVKLYEFFLSKCPESIKNRNDIFYPIPERSCVPDSPVWYSTLSIDNHTMDKMLTRILLVREIQEAHLHAQPIYL